VGEYSIIGGQVNRSGLGLRLLSPTETSLNGVDQIEFAEQLKVTAGTQPAGKWDRSLWWPAVVRQPLGVLAIEWWWFNRRVLVRRDETSFPLASVNAAKCAPFSRIMLFLRLVRVFPRI
jgi:hypothetical protein